MEGGPQRNWQAPVSAGLTRLLPACGWLHAESSCSQAFLQVPAGNGFIRMPSLADLLESGRKGRVSQLVAPLHRLADAQVIHGQDIQAIERKHQQHLGRLSSNPADRDERGDDLLVGLSHEPPRRDPSILESDGQVFEVPGFLLGDSGGLQHRRRSLRNRSRCRPAGYSARKHSKMVSAAWEESGWEIIESQRVTKESRRGAYLHGPTCEMSARMIGSTRRRCGQAAAYLIHERRVERRPRSGWSPLRSAMSFTNSWKRWQSPLPPFATTLNRLPTGGNAFHRKTAGSWCVCSRKRLPVFSPQRSPPSAQNRSPYGIRRKTVGSSIGRSDTNTSCRGPLPRHRAPAGQSQ